jgi:acyl carrier protein
VPTPVQFEEGYLVQTDYLERRLGNCFRNVFPGLGEEDMAAASMDSVEAWDSLKMMTLIVVLEEEFEVEIPLDEIENLISFKLLKNFLSGA